MGGRAMRILEAAQVWTPLAALCPGWVRVRGERIVALGEGPPPGPAERVGTILCPGFVDIHLHGGFGHDLPEGAAALAAVAAGLVRHGCTTYLPTTVTAPWPETLRAVRDFAAAVDSPPPGARPAGIHLEGPFLNPRRPGMQSVGAMLVPDLAAAQSLDAAAGGSVRTVTLAPELPGGLELARFWARRGVAVSMAHSDATYDEAVAAVAAGVSRVTHCFNAMSPLHHRAPGLVGAALDLEGLRAEAIADGVHLHPAMLRLLWRVKGWAAVCLVSDAMAGAGAPDGHYPFGGTLVEVRDGRARLPDGTLAGSVLTLDRAVRMAVEAGIPPREAVGMASLTPAEAVGLRDAGRIAPGARADLVALDPGLRPVWTMVGGRVCWDEPPAGQTAPGPGSTVTSRPSPAAW